MKIFEGFLKFESVTIVIVNASQYDHLEEVCQTLICIYVCLQATCGVVQVVTEHGHAGQRGHLARGHGWDAGGCVPERETHRLELDHYYYDH